MTARHSYLLPVAIVIAGAVIAGALYLTRSSGALDPAGDPSFMRSVSPEDHLVGNPDADVIIVEYSDIDCAYCKTFQGALTQLMSEYAPGGRVAWVYRHFPVINLHQYATSHAEAAECIAEAGGTERFFRFIDALHQAAPGNMEFNPSNYGPVVESLDLSVSTFTSCMDSDRHGPRVAADFQNALDAGGSGTPYTILLVRGNEPIPIHGALPYNALKEVIETALSNVR